jgi:hypothetical protein
MYAKYSSLGRGATLQTRLAPSDHLQFIGFAKSKGQTQAELLREAALFYLDYSKGESDIRIEGAFANELGNSTSRLITLIEKSTNRICSLMAKTAISSEATNQFLMNMDNGAEIMERARQVASKRIRDNLNPKEKEIASIFSSQAKEV